MEYAKTSSGKFQLMKVGVDLVWGNKRANSGLEHIIDKHLIRYGHYNTVQEIVGDIIDSFKELNEPHSKVKITPVDFDENDGTPKFELLTKKGTRLVIGSRVSEINDGFMLKYFILISYEGDKDWAAFKNSKEEAEQRSKQVEEYIEKVKKAR